jgi:NTE family protein
MPDISVMDFNETGRAAQVGEQAAREHIDKIKQLGVSDEEYRAFLEHQRLKELEPVTIHFVDVEDRGRVHPGTIKGRIATTPGEILDLEKLQEDLTRVYAMGNFETVNFSLAEKEGKQGLVIQAKEKPWGPNYLKLGINASTQTDGHNRGSFVSGLRMTELNKLGGELRIISSMGEPLGLHTDLYQPLDIQNFLFLNPRFSLERRTLDIYQGSDRIGTYRTDSLIGGLDFGVNLYSYLEARAGVELGAVKAEPETGIRTLPEFDTTDQGAFVGQIAFDQIDNHTFPERGFSLLAKYYNSSGSLGADYSYEKLNVLFSAAATLARKHTFLTGIHLGIGLDEDIPFYDEFTLGGLFSLSGYGIDQLRGQNRGLGRIIYMYRLAEGPLFVKGTYLGASLEAGNVWDDRDDIDLDDLKYAGSVFVGLDTFVGPVYLAYGHAESEEGRFYFYLGQTF